MTKTIIAAGIVLALLVLALYIRFGDMPGEYSHKKRLARIHELSTHGSEAIEQLYGYINEKDATENILDPVTSESISAINSLGGLHDQATFPYLARLLKTRNRLLRGYAAINSIFLPDPRPIIPCLIESLEIDDNPDDPKVAAFQRAVIALNEICHDIKIADKPSGYSTEEKKQIVTGLKNWWQENRDYLILSIKKRGNVELTECVIDLEAKHSGTPVHK